MQQSNLFFETLTVHNIKIQHNNTFPHPNFYYNFLFLLCTLTRLMLKVLIPVNRCVIVVICFHLSHLNVIMIYCMIVWNVDNKLLSLKKKDKNKTNSSPSRRGSYSKRITAINQHNPHAVDVFYVACCTLTSSQSPQDLVGQLPVSKKIIFFNDRKLSENLIEMERKQWGHKYIYNNIM